MSDDYRFLENLAYFLQQGYLIQDVLEICEFIFNTNKVKGIKRKLNNGLTLDEAIIEEDFNHTFIEYFKFFRIKNNLSKAIIQSLEICKTKDYCFFIAYKETKQIVPKQKSIMIIIIGIIVNNLNMIFVNKSGSIANSINSCIIDGKSA